MMRHACRPWFVAVALIATCVPASAATKVVPASQVAVASTTGNALVLWDATEMVNQLGSQKVPSGLALHQIEVTGGKLLVEKAKGLTPAATAVTVRIMYASSPLVEVYRSATFEGFEKLALVSASRGAAVTNADAWNAALAKNKIPPGMTVTVVGALPKS